MYANSLRIRMTTKTTMMIVLNGSGMGNMPTSHQISAATIRKISSEISILFLSFGERLQIVDDLLYAG